MPLSHRIAVRTQVQVPFPNSSSMMIYVFAMPDLQARSPQTSTSILPCRV